MVKRYDLAYLKPSEFDKTLTSELADELIVIREGGILNSPILTFLSDRILNLTSSANVPDGTDVVFCTGTLTATLVDPATATRGVTLRNISGTTTLATAAGTIEVTSLTLGQSVTFAPRSTGWFVI